MSDAPTVIITGAGSGIGAATAKRFARDGYNTVLNGRTREKLESIASEIEGDRVKIVAGDVSKVEDVDALVAETLDAFGRLDVLV
ncbi:MAG TPA: 3-oxoacyl-ACP reductase, partial [Hyphomonas atlantica]|nr:3-oxoacyl-ACP reductase [Hyphomonas atlantica]